MADQFLGEIRMFAGNFAIQGWALCNGQLLAIAQHTALFAILGTQYGGDGVNTFALPNLQGRVPIHQGEGIGLSNRVIGEVTGTPDVTLSSLEMPAHTHVIGVSSSAGDSPSASPSTAVGVPPTNAFGPVYNMAPMAANAGGGQAHDNMQPYLVVNFIIALEGIFPARN